MFKFLKGLMLLAAGWPILEPSVWTDPTVPVEISPVPLPVQVQMVDGAPTSTVNFDLPTETATSDADDKYLVFFNYDDGHYYYGQMPDIKGSSFQHTYLRAGRYRPYLEATLVYDDTKNPPPAIMFPGGSTPHDITISANSGITHPKVAIASGKNSFVQPIRRLVPGHQITFAVTVEPRANCAVESARYNGVVQFEYDAAYLKFDSLDNYPGFVPTVSTPTMSTVSGVQVGTVSVPIADLPRFEQRTMFFNFVTNPDRKVGDSSTFTPRVIMNVQPTGLESCAIKDTFLLPNHAKIENSHDPNLKAVNRSELVLDDTGDLIYTIHFQNDGHAPANTIHITDEFDIQWDQTCAAFDLLDDPSMRKISVWKTGVTLDNVSYSASQRKLSLTLNNAGLRGLKESGYGVAFNENATKGYIRFSLPVSCLKQPLPPCGAILNRAEIVFGCNPPLQTTLARTDLLCYPRVAPAPCNGCLDTVFTASTVSNQVGTKLLSASLEAWLRANYTKFKWYPVTDLTTTAVDNPNPILGQAKNRDYVLVASGPCHKAIIQVPVRVACNLDLAYTVTKSGGTCFDNETYDITVQATGSFNLNRLRWHDCSVKNSATMTLTNKAPGLYYFAVTNEQNGCYKEIWINVGETPKLQVDDDPTDLTFKPIITGGNKPYTISWRDAAYQLQSAPYTTGMTIGEALLFSGGTVTVTDANGCSATIWPRFNQ